MAETLGRRVVLISGAAGGIGSATAERFAAGGWDVALTDLEIPGYFEVAERVERLGQLVGSFLGIYGRSRPVKR